MAATVGIAAAVLVLLLGQAVSADPTKGEGTEDRRWIEGSEDAPVSPAVHDVIVERNQRMHARDGTALSYNLYLPDAEGPFPCLLIMQGYGKDGELGLGSIGDPADYAARGYAVMESDVRGMGSSQGTWDPFTRQQAEDGYDKIQWMAEQPWCNGKVGTFGPSYMGIVQFLTAKLLPPNLVAMSPAIGWGDAYLGWAYKGGMRALEDPRAWMALEEVFHRAPPSDGDPETFVEKNSNPAYLRLEQQYREHTTFDEFWEERSSLAHDHEAMARQDIAILFRTGFSDVFVYSMLKAYEEFAAADGARKLIIGEDTHDADGVPAQPYTSREYEVMWFDHWLKGIDNGVMDEPNMQLFVRGADQWRFEEEWPIRDATPTRLHLSPERSGSAHSLNDGSLAPEPPTEEGSSASYPYTPTQVAGGGHLLAGTHEGQDQRIDESRSLTWTSEVLEAPVEVTGPITLKFWGSSTATDTDFVARIADVAPDGSVEQLTRGWLKATHHSSHSDPTPLEPGETYEFTVEIWPISQVLDEGHRIRLYLSSSDVPLMEPNPNPAVNTIHHDLDHPSYVELPIIGDPAGLTRAPVGDSAEGDGSPSGERGATASQPPTPVTGGGSELLGLLLLLAGAGLARRRLAGGSTGVDRGYRGHRGDVADDG